MNKLHLVMGRGQIINPDGSIAWEEDWRLNTLADEGEKFVLDVVLREQANLNKWLGLLTVDPSETDTMLTVTEQVGNGYARQAFVAGGGDWSVPTLDSGDYMSDGVEKTFGPVTSSPWTIKHAFVTTTVSGTGGLFVLWIPLSATTVVAVGQFFKYIVHVKAQ